MASEEATESKWLSVIGRALAYLCMKSEAGEGRSLQQKAQFLENLGLSRADTASMLSSTTASITELHRRARQKGGRRRGSPKKKSRSRR
jgi:hypothetical protein